MKRILDFLTDLAANNNREWFAANKSRYTAANEVFNAFAAELLAEIQAFDPLTRGLTLRDCTYRIYRDTRFSHDKTPYKTHFGLYICPGGKKSGNPGYYFHVQPVGDGASGGDGEISGGGVAASGKVDGGSVSGNGDADGGSATGRNFSSGEGERTSTSATGGNAVLGSATSVAGGESGQIGATSVAGGDAVLGSATSVAGGDAVSGSTTSDGNVSDGGNVGAGVTSNSGSANSGGGGGGGGESGQIGATSMTGGSAVSGGDVSDGGNGGAGVISNSGSKTLVDGGGAVLSSVTFGGGANHLMDAGVFMPWPNVLRSVRDEVFDNGEAVLAALKKASKAGFELDRSNSLTRTPKGFPTATEWDDYLRLKDFHTTKPISEAYILAPDLARRAARDFRTTHEFMSLMQRAAQFAHDETAPPAERR